MATPLKEGYCVEMVRRSGAWAGRGSQCTSKKKYGDYCGVHAKKGDLAPPKHAYAYEVRSVLSEEPTMYRSEIKKITTKTVVFVKSTWAYGHALQTPKDGACFTPQAAATSYVLRMREKVKDQQKKLDQAQRLLAAAITLQDNLDKND